MGNSNSKDSDEDCQFEDGGYCYHEKVLQEALEPLTDTPTQEETNAGNMVNDLTTNNGNDENEKLEHTGVYNLMQEETSAGNKLIDLTTNNGKDENDKLEHTGVYNLMQEEISAGNMLIDLTTNNGNDENEKLEHTLVGNLMQEKTNSRDIVYDAESNITVTNNETNVRNKNDGNGYANKLKTQSDSKSLGDSNRKQIRRQITHVETKAIVKNKKPKLSVSKQKSGERLIVKFPIMDRHRQKHANDSRKPNKNDSSSRMDTGMSAGGGTSTSLVWTAVKIPAHLQDGKDGERNPVTVSRPINVPKQLIRRKLLQDK
ncbi:uncharacterized protein LOC121369328 [Gigantopelta aegis]|uniref:uncharacterized protein LOC121369328 n=1 Tax=Gigantopelta aegis TaxID=1735272 RepID=UPI001B88CA7E|nr:uncharacterized protein LOC121369328 [Gigantopelta aegis]